jgi:hypothetical protein
MPTAIEQRNRNAECMPTRSVPADVRADVRAEIEARTCADRKRYEIALQRRFQLTKSGTAAHV